MKGALMVQVHRMLEGIPIRESTIIGVCINTYGLYQSVLEKKSPIGQVYRKGRNVITL